MLSGILLNLISEKQYCCDGAVIGFIESFSKPCILQNIPKNHRPVQSLYWS